ncbi:MAG: PAS domain S-box protein, partial [Nitrospirae bacterium]
MAIASDAAVAIQRIDETSELERFKQIIETAFDVIVVTDTDGNITYVNPSFEQVTGYGRDEVIGKNPRILKSGLHDEEFYRHLWETISSGKPWKGEFV